ncbi:hypothetical protein PDJAM_G00150590 [Pangasius djambal]|uniref:Uncharacterized protein n=1 Tax=Pangasius djambal TaxID=1691987 RepID=A0ACC5ZH47_9TELE|nr:hypothetical protein [Pangasius djambal]
MASLADVGWKLLEFKARSKRSGSIYEPLKLSILHPEDEPLWEKLDRFYSAGKTAKKSHSFTWMKCLVLIEDVKMPLSHPDLHSRCTYFE